MEGFEEKVIESLSRLESHMTSLIGNGQPGRIKEIEMKVEDLQKNQWRFGGAVTGICLIISAIGAGIQIFFK